jgi:hypothetical protein
MGDRDAMKGHTATRAQMHGKEMVHSEGGRIIRYERGGGREEGFKNLLHYNSI